MRIADKRTGSVASKETSAIIKFRRKIDGDGQNTLAARRRALDAIPSLARLPANLLDELAAGTTSLTVPARAELFRTGEKPRGIYAIMSGQMELLLTSTGDAKVLAVLEPGMLFGIGAQFLDQPWPFTARALDSAILLFL